jgi:hypothetical protein
MGGFGSGFQGTAKATTRERHSVRVKDWGNLPPGARANWTITRGGWQDLGAVHVRVEADALALTYTPPNGTPRQQSIAIERAPCRFGGSRPWFLCPLVRAALWGALPRARRVLLSGLRGAELSQHARNPRYPSGSQSRPDTGAARLACRYRVRPWPQAQGDALADLPATGGGT